MGLELKDILVKKSGWHEFIHPVDKKLLPIVFPAGVMGYIFFNVAKVFMEKLSLNTFESKMFIAAVILLYLWFLLQSFMLSCWIYTLVHSYQKQ